MPKKCYSRVDIEKYRKELQQIMELWGRNTTRNCRTPVVYDKHGFDFDHALLG